MGILAVHVGLFRPVIPLHLTFLGFALEIHAVKRFNEVAVTPGVQTRLEIIREKAAVVTKVGMSFVSGEARSVLAASHPSGIIISIRIGPASLR